MDKREPYAHGRVLSIKRMLKKAGYFAPWASNTGHSAGGIAVRIVRGFNMACLPKYGGLFEYLLSQEGPLDKGSTPAALGP